MQKLGVDIVSCAYPNLVIALVGDLGAGKTTLTKGIGLALGIKRVINSPTFTIMKVYDTLINIVNMTINNNNYKTVLQVINLFISFQVSSYRTQVLFPQGDIHLLFRLDRVGK